MNSHLSSEMATAVNDISEELHSWLDNDNLLEKYVI